MADYKKQHFVPQSYLRRFSKDGKQIQVFDKFSGKSFSSGIRNVAQESHFYKIPDEVLPAGVSLTEDEKMAVEKALGKFEGGLNQCVNTIITLPPGIAVPRKVREEMSILIAVQLLRTRKYRKLIGEMAEKFGRAIAEDLIKKNFGEEALKYMPEIKFKDKYAGVLQSREIFDFDNLTKMAQVFDGHLWIIGINNTKQPFYTSDNPVVMHTPLKDELLGVGIASPGIEIAFPLSSRYILILADRMIYDNGTFDDGKSTIQAANNVEYYNSLQIIHSDRQIFCEEPEFDLVEDMLNERPSLRNIESNSVEIKIME